MKRGLVAPTSLKVEGKSSRSGEYKFKQQPE
jgi:hypothetical protein